MDGLVQKAALKAVTIEQERIKEEIMKANSGFREGGQWFCPTCFTGFPLEADRGDQRQGGECVYGPQLGLSGKEGPSRSYR
jgi:hypothetical protein